MWSATLVLAHQRAADQGHVSALPQGQDRQHAHASLGTQTGGGGQVRGRHGHRAQERLLRRPGGHPGLRLALPVHHDGAQPLLLDAHTQARRAQTARRRNHAHAYGRRLHQVGQAEGAAPAHPGGAARCSQEGQGRHEGREGQGQGHGSPHLRCVRRAAAGTQGFGKLGLWLHGRAGGPATLPRDLLLRHRIRPSDDRVNKTTGGVSIQPRKRVRARRGGDLWRHRLCHDQIWNARFG
mmetsp:Transcript_10409/g.34487  ORF Transcript_10409/g.34487 Transcript_10409/m.34487 type:complete len:238 (-) Transcript_10409:1147-1860(-)